MLPGCTPTPSQALDISGSQRFAFAGVNLALAGPGQGAANCLLADGRLGQTRQLLSAVPVIRSVGAVDSCDCMIELWWRSRGAMSGFEQW